MVASITSIKRSDKPPGKPRFENTVWIPGGTFKMGSDNHYPEEAPAHLVTVEGFWMDQYTITNAQFSRFVEKTGYVTLAERAPNPADYPGAKPEMLIPASVVFSKPAFPVDLQNPYNWWTYVPAQIGDTAGTTNLLKDWRSTRWSTWLTKMPKHASWLGKELPSEAEWVCVPRRFA